MKKIFNICFLFMFLFSQILFSQQEKSFKGKASIGIFSGISLNTNSYEFDDKDNFLDTSYSNDIKTSFNIGMNVTYDFTKYFGLKLQGQYTSKGGISTVNTLYGSSLTQIERKYKSSIGYLQFSLLPQVNLPFSELTDESKAFFNAGGYLSVKLSAWEYLESETTYQSLNLDKDISNSLTGTDAGLIFGGGIIHKNFFLDIRYDLGLTNIVDDPDLKDILSIKNSSINFSIGYIGGL